MSAYVDLYKHIQSTEIEQQLKDNICIKYWQFVQLSIHATLKWNTPFSNEDLNEYINFANNVISQIDISEVDTWLDELTTKNQKLKNIIPMLDCYKQIPKEYLDTYKAMDLSDAKCCALYKEQLKHNLSYENVKIEIDF